MVLSPSWTAGFTRAIDDVLHNSNLVEDALHSRAGQCLKVLNGSGSPKFFHPLEWAERIHKATPRHPIFTARTLFDAMYHVADELSLFAGKRYVSAAICACADYVANVGGTQEEQAALLAEVLSHLSTTWAAFVLWPFYARGHMRNHEPVYASGDATPTAQRVAASRAKEHHRRWKNQVMRRDNYLCPISGSYEYAISDLPALPSDARFMYLEAVPIIQRVVLTRDMWGDTVEHGMAAHLLRGYFGVDETLYEELDGPQNGLIMNETARTGFRRFLFILRPTEKPHCYAFKNYKPWLRFGGSQDVSDHITFADHSSTSPIVQEAAATFGFSIPEDGVALPSRDLLRLQASLAGVLRLSGAGDVFDGLRIPPSGSLPAHPSPRGAAFWRSVVEYEGPAICVEAELRDSIAALAEFRNSVPECKGD